jgi:hypothetical protein
MALGIGLGSIIGGVGGAIQASEARRAAKKQRRRVRAGIKAGEQQAARSLGTTLSSPEFLAGSNFLRSFFGIQSDIGTDVQETLRGEFGKDALSQKDSHLTTERLARNAAAAPRFGTGGGGTPLDALSANFAKGLRQAQAARGLSGQSAVGAEASGLAAFRTKLQIGLLPQLFGLAERPSLLRGRIEDQAIRKNVFAATGGAVAFGQAQPSLADAGILGPTISGAIQGGGAGGSLQAGGGSGGLGSLLGL